MIKQSTFSKCGKHHKDIVLIGKNIGKLCMQCITDLLAAQENSCPSIQDAVLLPENISNLFIRQLEDQSKKNTEILMKIKIYLANWKSYISKEIDKIIDKIDNQIYQINDTIKGIARTFLKMEETVQFSAAWGNIKSKLFKYSDLSNDIVQSVFLLQQKQQELYEDVISNTGLYTTNDIIEALEELNKYANQNDEEQQNQQIFEQLLDKSVFQEDLCRAIAFSQDCSIMISGHVSNKIKIYNFKNEEIKFNQELSEHTNIVQCLHFMKHFNQFVSGSFDKTIRIWSFDNSQSIWYCQEILREHISAIQCMIMNENEDFIISGSRDNSIKFWSKGQRWTCIQTLTNHDAWVSNLSLNHSQNQLISCQAWGDKLLVYQLDSNSKLWILKQTIITTFGYSLCFIDDGQFVYQPKGIDVLHIYQVEEGTKKYKKAEELQLNSISESYDNFNMQFIKENSQLIHKSGKCLYLTRIENNEFILEQQIKFETEYIVGAITINGRYFVTYDDKNKGFQVRKNIK
ncbi:unnamed protein product (macronuclear) [Paramecium tetraurelia]|uniref:Uncharacterized protein n=1 Tax=Paramecium tetraurelia TaxID=5888 RepID=A0DXI9_PARTE|nr:uncharacterized protein GSPATT00021379001 [Paramecium tetraurelia]CAK87756.1 unnamed protein product [Paramecium tetraurelia]|eukprot:XP_001455153.1 hypothetical protein (macronuclear) [Paramecium tetraurelia strain d4-2]